MYSVLKANQFDSLSNAYLEARSLSLSEIQIAEFERHLLEVPDDIAARIKLLGSYSRTSNGQIRWDFPEARRKHVTWIIENLPGQALACLVTNELEPLEALDFIDDLAELWNEQIRKQSDNFDVLFNSSIFFENIGLHCDALNLARQARKLKGKDHVIDSRIMRLKGYLPKP